MKHILLCLITIITFSSCRKANKDPSANVLNMNLRGNIETLDPAISYDSVSATILYQAYEPLYQYHYLKRPYTLIPGVAAALPEISDDGLEYTIKIKKDVKFHKNKFFDNNQRFLTVHDIITQIKRLAYKGTRSNGWFLFDKKIVGLNEFREKAKTLDDLVSMEVKGLEPVNNHTLVIKLTEPYPQMIYALSMTFTAPVPKEVVLAKNNNLNDTIVGTGPFFLDKWNHNLNVIMKKFPYYRNETYPTQGDRIANDRGLLKDASKKIPFIDMIKMHIILEDQPRWLNFLAGKLDLLRLPKDNYTTAIQKNGDISDNLKKKGIRLQTAPTLTYWWLSFNMRDEILGKNKNLRLAIASAINVERYISLFTNNRGQRAFSIYTPGIPGYSPKNQLPYDYNMEKAKQYLKKAGYPKGKGLPTFVFDTRGNSSSARQQAEYIKNELGKIGIKLQINMNTFPGFLKKARSGKLQLWFDGWALDYPDAENILQLLISKSHPPGPNSTYYSNKEFDAKFNELKVLRNNDRKFAMMRDMEKIVWEDVPWVMMFYERRYILHYDHIKNYRFDGLINNYMKYLKVVNKK